MFSLQRRVKVISPKEKVVFIWNLIIALFSLVSVTVSLFELFFNSTVSTVKVIRHCLDVIFLFNIISRFYIGYESHGVVITDAQQVQLTYLRTWFVIDLLSVLPLEVLRYAFPELHFMHVNRCLRVLRLFTIISSFSNEPDTNKIHVELLKSFSIMVICVQVSACIWFHQACEAAYDGHPRHCPKMKGWLNLLPQFSTNLKGATDLEYYAVSLYWAVITLTTVGYGEIHAMNGSETVVASVVMVIGLVAFLGAIMTGLSSVISNLDRRRGRFYHRMETICSYMKHMDLPEDVQTLVQTSYHNFWIHQKGCNAGGLFDDLPFTLQSEVSRFRNKNILEKCELLKETEDGFKSALSLKFKTQTFNPGHILSRSGEINQNLYYIEQGQMKVFGRDKTDCIATLLPGFLIGEVGLMYKIPRNATICTATLCEVCVLENHDLLTLFADYPEAGVKIAEAARTRLYKVSHHIQEAFAFGHASMPDNILFHKDLIVSSEAQDQKIVIPFRDFALKQTAHHNTDIKKFFWQKIIRPDGAFAKVWEVIMIWSIIVSIFILTWVLFFTNNEETVGFYSKGWGAVYLAVSYGIDIVAAADIFVTLHTAVVTKDGYISDLSKIAEHYKASGNLYYDLLALCPLDWIALYEDETDYWRVLGYFRCNRLLWLRKIYLYFNAKENDMKKNVFKQRTAKCIFLLIFSVHCCSGILYVSACNVFRCDENSWAWNSGLKTAQCNFYHYMYAAYFSTTTMTTGYGDIVPSTMIERLASVIVAFIGLFVFNFIISQIYATLSSKNAARMDFQHLISATRLFMEQHDLSVSLQTRVIEYMRLLWTKYQGEAYPGGPFLMYDLPLEIQRTVLMNERGGLLLKIPYFEYTEQAFIEDLASSSVLYYFPRGEIVQYSGTITRELFFVRRGTCQILNEDLSEIVGLYGEGMYFGEASFLFGIQALMTVRAKTYCEILVLDFKNVKPILKNYPVIKSQIEELRNKDYYFSLVEKVKNMMTNVSFKKSKCYVEDLGNFPIYAGAEEETSQEKLHKMNKTNFLPQRPRPLKEQLEHFFFSSCLSVILMRNAILPSSRLYEKWEIFRVILAVTVSIISSLLFAFLHYKFEIWIISYILLVACWVDIYIRFHLAFYKDTCLIFDTLETSRHYITTAFLLDLISCFPWEFFLMMFSDIENGFYGNNEILHLYAYMRAPHILQLYRVPLAFSFWQSGNAAGKNIFTFLQFFLYSMFFLHFSTCIIFASVCPAADIYGDTTKYLFPVIKHNCTQLSWVSHMDNVFEMNYATNTFFELYSISLYFATATVCGFGFGDLHPYLFYMKIVMIFIMIVGALYCGLLSGALAAMLANADATRTAFTEKMESIKLFLKSNNITGDLYNNTLQFYAFIWIRTKGIDQDTIFKYLPSSLLGDISTIIYAEVITKAFGLNMKRRLQTEESVDQELTCLERNLSGKLDQPFFKKTLKKESMDYLETEGGFIRMLAQHFRRRFYKANDLIWEKDEFGSEMYFIHKGEVEVLSQNEKTVIIKLRAGQYFGEDSLLFAEPRSTTIKAATNCDLYVLSKKGLDETISYYPDICNQIKEAAALKKDQSYLGIYQMPGDTTSQPENKLSLKESESNEDYEDAVACLEEIESPASLPLPSQNVEYFSHFLMSVLDRMIHTHNTTVGPENTMRIIYQYSSCLLIIISFWAITYMPTVFDLDKGIYLFTMIIEYFQMIEILLKFHIGYYDDNGSYISDYKSVSRHYMNRKIGYIYDVICSFPYSATVLYQMNEMAPMTFLPLLVHVRSCHLLRIVTVLVFMWKEEQSITTNLICFRIIKNLVNTIFFVHSVAVCFVAIVIYSGINTWVQNLEIYLYPDIYRYAVYWTLTTYTTAGYGDIGPKMFGEVIFIIFLMILSKLHVNYNMGHIYSTQTNRLERQATYEEKLQSIKTYMMDQNIPSPLQNRVIQFYNYRWTRTKGIDSETMFKDLSHCMKADIFSRITMSHLKKHDLFNDLSNIFLRHLSTKMILRSYISGEYIQRKGDRGEGMHLLIIGKVKVCSNQAGTEFNEDLSAGALLGVYLLLKQELCRDTVVAQDYVDIFFLSKVSFDEAGSYYPNDMKKLLERGSNIKL
ncbi:uncharacterized protein [Hoplias malabaricus]|uniref:uncharacterized protein isoform X2 n=1 Tax=Hoplias malabaricus TaxID=27720 RepID=UPI0034633A62